VTTPAERRTGSPVDAFVRALLKTAPVRRLRAGLRDVYWRRRGARLRNPAMPSRIRTILFVCKGNICRSPFAERVAARAVTESGLTGLRCLSAGITANQAATCPPEAVQAASAHGLPMGDHVPARLTGALIQESDLVVVMEADQIDVVGALYPESRGKLWLLPFLDPSPASTYERYNLADPFGRSADEFDYCYDRIERSVRELIAEIASR
jgi:protein-tyrosine phosphatase